MKSVSDSCLELAKCEVRELWNRLPSQTSGAAIGAAIGAASGAYVPLHPMLQQEVHKEPEPEELLFGRVVSDNVLLGPNRVCEKPYGSEA